MRTFTFDAESFWRESSAGVSPVAFFASRALADMPTLALRAIVFALVFWSCALVNVSLGTLSLLLLGIMLVASGARRLPLHAHCRTHLPPSSRMHGCVCPRTLLCRRQESQPRADPTLTPPSCGLRHRSQASRT